MGVCGYILPCLALNNHVVQGWRLSGRLAEIGDSRAWLARSQTRVEPGHKEELNRADM
jgi:hypothetical protein